MSQVKVEVEVGACKLENDGTSFLDYSYDVRLICVDMFDKRMQIKSTRTLLDFCDLESRLMKTLVQHNVLSPFHAITMGIRRKHMEVQRQRREEGGHNLASKLISLGMGTDDSSAASSSSSSASGVMDNYQYQPIFGGEREQYLKSNFDDEVGQDNLLIKSTELGVWMLQVCSEPSILDDESFALFFSTEEKCYRRQRLISGDSGSGPGGSGGGDSCGGGGSSDYDFLLPTKHIRTKTLLSKHTEKIEVQRGQIVLWRFTSSKNDLAFSVDLNGRSLLGAKKYPSSSDEIVGSLEIASSTSGVGNLVGNGLCELKFDNKYAKMMTPTQMKFYCRAVDPTEYVDCQRRATEKREREGRREAALAVVTGIFSPRSALLRQKGGEGGARSHVSATGTGARAEVGTAFLSGQQQQQLGGGGGLVSGGSVPGQQEQQLSEAQVLSLVQEGGAEAVRAVRRLLGECSELRAENEQLGQKCEQLQSKIDVVLNFANTNNTGNSSSSKKQPPSPSSSSSSSSSSYVTTKMEVGRHQRRQTYAATSTSSTNTISSSGSGVQHSSKSSSDTTRSSSSSSSRSRTLLHGNDDGVDNDNNKNMKTKVDTRFDNNNNDNNDSNGDHGEDKAPTGSTPIPVAQVVDSEPSEEALERNQTIDSSSSSSSMMSSGGGDGGVGDLLVEEVEVEVAVLQKVEQDSDDDSD